MSSPYTVTSTSCDEAYSALIGNGQLASTVSPSGFHVAPDSAVTPAHRTQYFVWSGRRGPGPQHPLLSCGRVWRRLLINGRASSDTEWRQEIDPFGGCVNSVIHHGPLTERTISFVALTENCFLADTCLELDDSAPMPVSLQICVETPLLDTVSDPVRCPDGAEWRFRTADNIGSLRALAAVVEGDGHARWDLSADRGVCTVEATVGPGKPIRIRTLLQFSDRLAYAFPRSLDDWDSIAAAHHAGWAEFQSRSSVHTSSPKVDALRALGLYTLRCQTTPWSVPPTLSEPYWGAGAFHDEMYPFFALQSANCSDLALRPLMFRLATLPRAVERGIGRGALYPWSSTETGDERDPDGLWLTERFHLGQFSAEIWTRWLYQADTEELADLYPVLREVARYYASEVVRVDDLGCARTIPCVDFDESVGSVTNGPFTVSAASAALLWAAEAADRLAIDQERAVRWRRLSHALQTALPTSGATQNERFGIPDGQPLHYSILGPIFPFRVEVGTPRARRSAAHIHAECRSSLGWKPGMSAAFIGSTWIWTAGHLAAVHSMHADHGRAWEAVVEGAAGCGPGLMPCEHIDRAGRVVVPWFTTGIAAWIYGLHALFVWVDEHGTHLLDGCPEDQGDMTFDQLRGAAGVRLSGEVRNGRIERLVAVSPRAQTWRLTVPRRWLEGLTVQGRPLSANQTHEVREIELPPDVVTSLIST